MSSLHHDTISCAGGATCSDCIDRLAAFIARHPRLLVLTGAGISTASGIPGYRDADGARRGRAPIQGPEFRASEAARKRYWARSMVGWPMLAAARPNAGHRALAALQRAGRVAALITQNVDGLHSASGSADVLELHGNIHRVACLACGASQARRQLQQWLAAANPALAALSAIPAPDGDAQLEPEALADFALPCCAACGGTLQPDVVFFGDAVPGWRTEEANRRIDAADALLVLGSSLMVHSGYRLCVRAVQAGKPVAAVNQGKTRADALLAFKLEESTEHLLPLLAERLSAAPA
jgi:NAD-dependent SIR2 family protein deacetylase